jgi:hypothetical protein
MLAWLSGALLAQAVMNVPAHSPAAAPGVPADPARLSLVIADTVSETDPQPLCDRPDCTAMFLGRYRNATILAGPPLAAAFAARVEMGSPWNRPTRLAMIVEQRDGREMLVRAMAGFNLRTGEACFEAHDTDGLGWHPEGPGIVTRRDAICVREAPRG